jgi:hypothetical protein
MSIPVVSLAPIVRRDAGADATVARDLKTALASWGAFELVDDGVPLVTIEGAFAAAATFFRQPVEERLKVRIDRHNRGYAPLHQTVYPGNLPDLKESFNVGTRLTADDPDIKAGKPLQGSISGRISRFLDRRRKLPTASWRWAIGSAQAGRSHPRRTCGAPRKPVAFGAFHHPTIGNVAQNEPGAAEHKDWGF